MAHNPARNLLLILAPIPLVAASFIILGQIIRRLGQQYSRLNAKWCTLTTSLFLTTTSLT